MTTLTKPSGAWARRRAAVQAEAETLERAETKALIAEKHAELAEKPEEEVLAELDLPNPDEMAPGDDFSAFMKAAVPTQLRNRALRTLWRSDPVLANVDMLVDYGEDFTGKGDALAVVKTIYQVGKGMLKDKIEEAPTDGIEEAPVAVAALDEEEEDTLPVPEIEQHPLPTFSEPKTPDLALRRRMRFNFQEGNEPEINGMELS
ncbi:MAG: DUF3306 domain-containing protein [Rhodobacteraceae bacterium]|nr:DUF3306 domain-containing protein [Paracoccaceae bacterium]